MKLSIACSIECFARASRRPTARPGRVTLAAAVLAAVAMLGAPDPGSAQPGSGQPGSAQPGSAQPGSAQPGSGQPGSAQPGSAAPTGAAPTGTAPAGTVPAGAAPAGAQPVDAVSASAALAAPAGAPAAVVITHAAAPARLAARRPWFYAILGGALLAPATSSSELELLGVDGAASLAIENGPIAGSGATVARKLIPAGILGGVLPIAGQRLSLEIVVGAPFTVKFEATGTLANESIAPMALGIPTGVGPMGRELGEATAVPLVGTVLFRLVDHPVGRAYVGAGPSVLIAQNPKVTNRMLTEVNQPEMTISNAAGLVLQGSLEARLPASFYARVDVKFIAFMKARAEVRNINVKTPGLPLFDSVEVGTATMDVTVNPFIVQVGLGYDFDIW
jgi:hypothetical protein